MTQMSASAWGACCWHVEVNWAVPLKEVSALNKIHRPQTDPGILKKTCRLMVYDVPAVRWPKVIIREILGENPADINL